MTKLHTGGCQCEVVRYEIRADPLMIYACHCTIYQRQSGSAFGMAVVFGGGYIAMTGIAPVHFGPPGTRRDPPL